MEFPNSIDVSCSAILASSSILRISQRGPDRTRNVEHWTWTFPKETGSASYSPLFLWASKNPLLSLPACSPDLLTTVWAHLRCYIWVLSGMCQLTGVWHRLADLGHVWPGLVINCVVGSCPEPRHWAWNLCWRWFCLVFRIRFVTGVDVTPVNTPDLAFEFVRCKHLRVDRKRKLLQAVSLNLMFPSFSFALMS